MTPTVRRFDRVIVGATDSALRLTRAQFFALPLRQRVRYLLADEVKFYAGKYEIRPAEALADLRRSTP